MQRNQNKITRGQPYQAKEYYLHWECVLFTFELLRQKRDGESPNILKKTFFVLLYLLYTCEHRGPVCDVQVCIERYSCDGFELRRGEEFFQQDPKLLSPEI